jgi:lipoprotein-anchoring transpeptidase ErfK/SrfK
MRRWLLATAGLLLALTGVALTAATAYAYFWDSSRADLIAKGVRVAGVDVGGLRAAQARTLLDRRIVTALERPVRLTYRGRRFTVAPSEAGLRVDVARMVGAAVRKSRDGGLAHRLLRDLRGRQLRASVPLRVALSNGSVAKLVRSVARVVDRPARSAETVPSATWIRILPEHTGIAVRRNRLRGEVSAALLDPGSVRTIPVPTRVVHPRWTRQTLGRRYPAFILVSRSTFTLRLYRHLRLYRAYRIAVGRAGLETPAGLYSIDDKQINPSWHVPNSAWAGDLAGRVIPPGPDDPIKARWLGFWNGSGIHGTDNISSLGTAASHGCIRMSIPDVEELYNLVPLHTPIYVG